MTTGESAGGGGAEGPLVVRGASVVRVVGDLPWWASLLGFSGVLVAHYSCLLAVLLVALQLAILARWRLQRRGTRVRTGAFTIDDRGIVLDRELLLHRPDVKDAYRVPLSMGEERRTALCVLAARGAGFEVTVDDDADARAILRKLGKDASMTTVTYRGTVKDPMDGAKRRRLVGPLDVLIVGVTVVFLGLFGYAAAGSAPTWMPLAAGAGLLTLYLGYRAITLLRKRNVTVGTDGVSIGAGDEARFLPWSRIASVTREDEDVTLAVLDNGTIVFTPDSLSTESNAAAAFVQRTFEAKNAKRRTRLRVDLAPLLGRGGRDAHEWMRAVEEVSDGERGYRVTTVARDELWRVALDPAADGDTRAGAVLALRRGLDDEERGRLRRAAERCAAPTLRALMDRVVADDEPALRELLEEGDERVPEKRARAR